MSHQHMRSPTGALSIDSTGGTVMNDSHSPNDEYHRRLSDSRERAVDKYFEMMVETENRKKEAASRGWKGQVSSMCSFAYFKEMAPSIILVVVAILALVASSVAQHNLNNANSAVQAASGQLATLQSQAQTSVDALRVQVKALDVDGFMRKLDDLYSNMTDIYNSNQEQKKQMNLLLGAQYNASVEIYQHINVLNTSYPYPWAVQDQISTLTGSVVSLQNYRRPFVRLITPSIEFPKPVFTVTSGCGAVNQWQVEQTRVTISALKDQTHITLYETGVYMVGMNMMHTSTTDMAQGLIALNDTTWPQYAAYYVPGTSTASLKYQSTSEPIIITYPTNISVWICMGSITRASFWAVKIDQ